MVLGQRGQLSFRIFDRRWPKVENRVEYYQTSHCYTSETLCSERSSRRNRIFTQLLYRITKLPTIFLTPRRLLYRPVSSQGSATQVLGNQWIYRRSLRPKLRQVMPMTDVSLEHSDDVPSHLGDLTRSACLLCIQQQFWPNLEKHTTEVQLPLRSTDPVNVSLRRVYLIRFNCRPHLSPGNQYSYYLYESAHR